MYLSFFKLRQAPFSIAPDPRFLFMSESHREALAHLLYGVNGGGGFVLLTGEIGAGKTTVCRCFLEQMPAHVQVAYILNPKLSAPEIVRAICEEFHIVDPGLAQSSMRQDIELLNRHLLASHAEGRHSVLIIDEAQCLSQDVLEQLRLLTNLETNDRKLLQIILIGQPELREQLMQPALEQLAQRVIARYHLGPLAESDVWHYIQHRMSVAGRPDQDIFARHHTPYICRITGGIPRRINLLCDRALLGAYAEALPRVSAQVLRRAALEVFPGRHAKRAPNRSMQLLLGLAALGIVGGALAAWHLHDSKLPVARSPVAVQPKVAPRPAAAAAPSSAPAVVTEAAPSPETKVSTQTVSSAEALTELPTYSADVRASEQSAERTLARLWGVKPGTGEPCADLAPRGLRCFHGHGSIADLRLINRPVVMWIDDEHGDKLPILLKRIDATRAWIEFDNDTKMVSTVALVKRYRGEFTTMWQAPEGFRDHYQGGEVGEDVDWIANRLALAHGDAPPMPGLPYGPRLTRKLREFQTASGIKADGMLGPVTLMLLSEDLRHTGPHISSTGETNR